MEVSGRPVGRQWGSQWGRREPRGAVVRHWEGPRGDKFFWGVLCSGWNMGGR